MPLSRRQMLQDLLGSSLLLLGASACKTKGIRVPEPSAAPFFPTPNPNPADPTDNSPVLDPFQPATDSSADCEKQAIIDTSKIPDIPESLETLIKIYGDSQSGMLVLDLPMFQYENANLQYILILRQNGKILCHKSITPADTDPKTKLIPVVFDNIALKGEKRLTILYYGACRFYDSGVGYMKFEMKQDLAFETSFLGKPVVSITPTQYNPGYGKYQAVIGVYADPKGGNFENVDNTNVMATTESKFILSGFETTDVVTDLLSRPLPYVGETSWDVLRFPEFMVYRLVNNEFYVRTLVRVY